MRRKIFINKLGLFLLPFILLSSIFLSIDPVSASIDRECFVYELTLIQKVENHEEHEIKYNLRLKYDEDFVVDDEHNLNYLIDHALGAPIEENVWEFKLSDEEEINIPIKKCPNQYYTIYINAQPQDDLSVVSVNDDRDTKEVRERPQLDVINRHTYTFLIGDSKQTLLPGQNISIMLRNSTSATEPTTSVPNTGDFTNPSSVDLGNIAEGMSVVLAIAFLVSFIVYYAKKHQVVELLTKLFSVTFVVTFVLAGVFQFNTNAQTNLEDDTDNIDNTNTSDSISLTINNFNLTVETKETDTFAYGKSEVIVNESTKHGYILSAYTTTPDLVHTEDNTKKISAITTSSSTSKTTLTTNTWGFSMDQPQDETSNVWQPLPGDKTNAITIKDLDNPTQEQDTTSVYYGVNVNEALPDGEYKGTVIYTVVPKPEIITSLDVGRTINVKMKNTANNTANSGIFTADDKIIGIARADFLPPDFVPEENNTISTLNSENPIYIFFDDATGILYYYSEADVIYMNKDSSYIFNYLYSLTDISGLSDWNTSNVTDMGSMFSGVSSLTNIDVLANWDTSSVINMNHMFDAAALTNIDGASDWDTSNVTDMSRMFSSVTALTNIDGASDWDTSNVTDMSYMFWSAWSLTNIDALIDWDTSSVTDMSGMFLHNSSLSNIDGAINWDTSSVTNMEYMFSHNFVLTNIDGAANWDTSNVTDMLEMFSLAEMLTNIDGASNWNTSNVTSMGGMFSNNSSLVNINALANWDTSNVTNMSYMFSSAYSLKDIDALSNWNTSSVWSMDSMFWHNTSLVDISGAANWDTSSVADIYNMFNDANNIDARVLNNWNISNIINKYHAFTCPTDKRPNWY